VLLSDFDYHLPEDLIAQEPLADRAASRELVRASLQEFQSAYASENTEALGAMTIRAHGGHRPTRA